jgi:hypothetical protein
MIGSSTQEIASGAEPCRKIELTGLQISSSLVTGLYGEPSKFCRSRSCRALLSANPDAAAQELTDYNALADALAYNDAYMVDLRP